MLSGEFLGFLRMFRMASQPIFGGPVKSRSMVVEDSEETVHRSRTPWTGAVADREPDSREEAA